MKAEVSEVLANNLPKGFNIIVNESICMGSEYLKIMFSPNTYEINQVKNQFPQAVSFSLTPKTFDLHVQHYSCMGGQKIYLIPNKEDPRERYLAMVGVKVPFRRPQNNKEAVLKALKMFCIRYIQTLKDNKDRLKYKDVVDYSFLD